MSVKVMAAVWDLELSVPQKLVLLAIADHADDEGLCWPSQARIAAKVGLSERQVRTHMRALVAAKHLEVVERRRQETTIWRVVTRTKQDRKDSSGQPSTKTGSSVSQDRKYEVAKTGSPLPTNHQENHQIEPSLFQTLVFVLGQPLDSQRSAYREAARELEKAGATPDDIVARAQRLVTQWSPKALTLNSLLKHWGQLGGIHTVTKTQAKTAGVAQAISQFVQEETE